MSRFFKRLKSLRIYRENLAELKRQQADSGLEFPLGKPYPCLNDRFMQSGTAKGHYFHQDLLVARRIFDARPERHLDVGSRVDGFVAHVAAFREIEVLDVRALENSVPNVRFRQCDLMADLPDEFVESTGSLSCLHALEHFGLGRYGDPVCYEGYLKGFANLSRIVKPGGTFYLSVPIGPQRIEFDAHRVFSLRYLLELVNDEFLVEEFSYVDDAGDLHEDVDVSGGVEDNFGCRFGCGILVLKKRESAEQEAVA